ncbi:class I mannose-6-phosphate isomerase [Galbibacter sp. PAP.153]|uniref:class I mannose-6-phosphate isomerase n=1 Tax=Galbibacter sp. PAP.153 TaxID=3104623 RepID=UPI00300AB498
MNEIEAKVRKTSQPELPVEKNDQVSGYDIYPTFDIGPDLIHSGYESLARALAKSPVIKIDGYAGVLFETVKVRLDNAFQAIGVCPEWVDTQKAYKPEAAIDQMIAPYLGGHDPVFGKIAQLELLDFFETDILKSFNGVDSSTPTIFYGTGASLIPVDGTNVYIDVSKNEIQYRSRAGSILNLGAKQLGSPKEMYKRFYFVDWVVLNRHKRKIKDGIDFLIDGQRSTSITWMKGDDWRSGINSCVQNPVRVRPWFEPGAWGGHWIENKIEGLSGDVENYAWSFELIVPENGVIFESSKLLLEFSFDFLMYHAGEDVLGNDFEQYQYEFPIRFDFLDTFDGGNLSIQCHPQKAYIKEHFGENITQEETYYILDRKDDAKVYLGFQKGVTPEAFQAALENSYKNKTELEVEQFVQVFEAEKHGLYLIPPGTIHSSGKDNLVLEVSSTPYIYTFKMYDWLRVDLDGSPRPINIDRGMENLVFERCGERVEEELISSPKVLGSDADRTLEHLPTHTEHLYDIHRYTIHRKITIHTENKAHVISLVEGQKMELTIDGKSFVFHYAESFIIPAGVGSYTIENPGAMPIMVLKAFIK